MNNKLICHKFYSCDPKTGKVIEELTERKARNKFGIEAIIYCLVHILETKRERPSATRPGIAYHTPAKDGTMLLVEAIFEGATDNDNFSKRNGYE